MGAYIEFARAGSDHWGRIDPEHGEKIGCAQFSAFTATGQLHFYGTCWHDCVVYLKDGEEWIGPRDRDAGPEEWYQPDWSLCAERARALLRKAQETQNEHRREYDLSRLPPFVEAIERCAQPENAPLCYLRISQ